MQFSERTNCSCGISCSPSFRLTLTTETTLERNQRQQMLVANSEIIVLKHFNISRLWSLPNSFFFSNSPKISCISRANLHAPSLCCSDSIHPYQLSASLAASSSGEDWSSSSLVTGSWEWEEAKMKVRTNTDVEISLVWIPQLLQVLPAFSPLRSKIPACLE